MCVLSITLENGVVALYNTVISSSALIVLFDAFHVVCASGYVISLPCKVKVSAVSICLLTELCPLVFRIFFV